MTFSPVLVSWQHNVWSVWPPPALQLVHNLSFSHSCGGMPPSAQSICTDMRKYASWLHFINRNTENQSQTMNCYRNNSTLQCPSPHPILNMWWWQQRYWRWLHQLSGKYTIQQSRLNHFECAYPWNSQSARHKAWKQEVWWKALFRTWAYPTPSSSFQNSTGGQCSTPGWAEINFMWKPVVEVYKTNSLSLFILTERC